MTVTIDIPGLIVVGVYTALFVTLMIWGFGLPKKGSGWGIR